MKTVGIIAEYNPFHTGHKYQLDQIRQMLHADYIVIAMSGDFVQRGTPALFPKHLRTRMALSCGADLVVELPVSVSTASAEGFAKGAVHLLSGLGVTDVLCFGSESTDTQLLMELARILVNEPEEYRQLLTQGLKEGLSFPAARSRALSLYTNNPQLSALLLKPNTILGIEYCKALFTLKSPVRPYALKREGSGYHDTDLSDVFPSASGIRARLFRDPATSFQQQIPAPAFSVFKKAIEEGLYLTECDLDLLYRYRLLLETPDSLQQYLDINEDLARRICACAWEYHTFTDFAANIKTKNVTQTRVQRALLHALLQIRHTPATFHYAHILGFRKDSSSLLSQIKKRGSMPLLSKAADAALLLSDADNALFQETVFASNLYQTVLSQKTGQPFIHEYSQPVVIL